MAKFKVKSAGGGDTHDSLEPMRTEFPQGSVIFAEGGQSLLAGAVMGLYFGGIGMVKLSGK